MENKIDYSGDFLKRDLVKKINKLGFEQQKLLYKRDRILGLKNISSDVILVRGPNQDELYDIEYKINKVGALIGIISKTIDDLERFQESNFLNNVDFCQKPL